MKHVTNIIEDADLWAVRTALEAVLDFMDILPEGLDQECREDLVGSLYEGRPMAALECLTDFVSRVTVAASKDGLPVSNNLSLSLQAARRGQ